jgi:hypothetical protein
MPHNSSDDDGIMTDNDNNDGDTIAPEDGIAKLHLLRNRGSIDMGNCKAVLVDSRVFEKVSKKNIIGKPVARIWSLQPFMKSVRLDNELSSTLFVASSGKA